jgi:hypothetical protein
MDEYQQTLGTSHGCGTSKSPNMLHEDTAFFFDVPEYSVPRYICDFLPVLRIRAATSTAVQKRARIRIRMVKTSCKMPKRAKGFGNNIGAAGE